MKDDNSVHSSSSGTGTGSDVRGSMGSPEETDNSEYDIAKSEGSNVRRAKCTVLLVFFLCAGAVSAAMYIFTKQTEKNNFEIEVSQRDRQLRGAQINVQATGR
jgi:hypothetical protein